MTPVHFRLHVLVPLLLAAASQASAVTTAYYQFNATPGMAATGTGSIVDSTGNTGQYGTPSTNPAPAYSANVPVNRVPQTSQSDPASLQFGGNNAAVSYNYQFPFNTLTAGTMEFWINPQNTSTTGDQDYFWTRLDSTDANRFNLGVSNNSLFLDYRDPNGTLHSLTGGLNTTLTPNTWTFIAIVKNGNVWSTYENNTLVGSVTDTAPNLPNNTGWTISGRGSDPAVGLLDELRFSNTALAPSQFLNVPEPSAWAAALAGVGFLAFALRRRADARHASLV